MKKGFTLAEVLIVILIIGFLAVIALSALMKAIPKKNKVLFKKAYLVTERIVSEMAADEYLYPYVDEETGAFENDKQVELPIFGETAEKDIQQKFCQIFASKLNVVDDIQAEWASKDVCYFHTNEGIYWDLSDSAFENGFIDIAIDTKGKDIEEGSRTDLAFVADGDEVDEDKHVFRIRISSDGRVSVVDATEKEFLKSQSVK